jgi:glutamine synthetase
MAAPGLLTLTFVDNGGITRAKTVPYARLDYAATAGIGASTTFGIFTGRDLMAVSGGLEIPTGDFRLVADRGALVRDGDWAWAPADIRDTEGDPWPLCSRTFAHRMERRARDMGLDVRMTFETEWTAWRADGTPAHQQPAYGLEPTRAAGDLLLAVARRLDALGVPVDQLHPEYSPGQLEASVGAATPVEAADRAVHVRDVIRTVHRERGASCSLSPRPSMDGLGNGAHLHFSLWRGDRNLCGTGDGPHGLDTEAAAFLAGVLSELPALVAVGCAAPVSYLRLGPSRWTGAYTCWGLENREAPLRLIRGSASARPEAANVELKTVDASGNPYLVIGAVLAAGLAGIEAGLPLPAECTIDPATMTEQARRDAGYEPLPDSLEAAAAALRSSGLMRDAKGPALHDALAAVREREAADAAGATDEELCELYRYRF